MTKVAIMLGGNLPGTREAMGEAIKSFAANGLMITAQSSVYASEAVDCVPGTPDFLDMAISGNWQKSAAELLHLGQAIERAAGRPAQHSSRESRILDCDIILFGDMQINTAELTIPHPRARQRRFVMEPLAEIIPDWVFPGTGGKLVGELYREL